MLIINYTALGILSEILDLQSSFAIKSILELLVHFLIPLPQVRGN